MLVKYLLEIFCLALTQKKLWHYVKDSVLQSLVILLLRVTHTLNFRSNVVIRLNVFMTDREYAERLVIEAAAAGVLNAQGLVEFVLKQQVASVLPSTNASAVVEPRESCTTHSIACGSHVKADRENAVSDLKKSVACTLEHAALVNSTTITSISSSTSANFPKVHNVVKIQSLPSTDKTPLATLGEHFFSAEKCKKFFQHGVEGVERYVKLLSHAKYGHLHEPVLAGLRSKADDGIKDENTGISQQHHQSSSAVISRRQRSRSKFLAIYPGSFNPPTHAHFAIASTVAAMPEVDALWMDLTTPYGNKTAIATVVEERRIMVDLLLKKLPKVGCAALMSALGDAGFGSSYFDALRVCANFEGPCIRGPEEVGRKVAWVVGSDVVQGMVHWKDKARDVLSKVDMLIVFIRLDSRGRLVQNNISKIVPINTHDNNDRSVIAINVVKQQCYMILEDLFKDCKYDKSKNDEGFDSIQITLGKVNLRLIFKEMPEHLAPVSSSRSLNIFETLLDQVPNDVVSFITNNAKLRAYYASRNKKKK